MADCRRTGYCSMQFFTVFLSVMFFCDVIGPVRAVTNNQSLTEADIIQVNSGIQVPFGRSTYLHPERNLKINVRQGDWCTIKVIENEPLTQRPGKLTPSEFECSFGETDVIYTHYGARSPAYDKVKLLLRYDTPYDTIIVPFIIQVEVTFEQLEIVTKNIPLTVDELNGISNPIDNKVLQFTYDKQNQNCKVTVFASDDGLPYHGELVNATLLSGVTEDCDTFLQSDIRYKHTSTKLSPNFDYIPMMVELTDKDGNLLKQEYFHVAVRILKGEENTAPQPSFSSLLLMDVNQFVMTAITPIILSAEDVETPREKLVFNITSSLSADEGSIISTDDRSLPITSFDQKDLDDLKIAYKPPASDSDVRRVFQVDMEVIDSDGVSSDPFTLMIIVNPMNTLAPMAVKNTGLVLFEGQSRKLQSSKNLQISDEDNLNDVTLTVIRGLKHGQLLKNGAPVKQFTPADLDAGSVTYVHDGTDSYSDNIIFRVDDGKHQIEFLFPITVYPVDDEPPIVVMNRGITLRKGEEVEITPFVLSATDIDSNDFNIKFQLVEPSIHGQILLKRTDIPPDPHNWVYNKGHYEKSVTSWTIKELLQGKIFYRHVGEHISDPVMDYLKFRVSDDHDPPNESEIHEFVAKILPVDDIPPQLHPDAQLQMVVDEFQQTDITKQQLRYTDEDTPDKQLKIRITKPPYDTDLNNPMSPGKIVYSDHPNTEVTTFTQAEVNHHKIAFKPPATELGIVPRIIQFDFEVEDAAGNVLPSQTFVILLRPVNNKPPVIRNQGMTIYENGMTIIGPEILDATDPDTDSNTLTFTITQAPTHGTFQLGPIILAEGDTFTRTDITGGFLSYAHNGEEGQSDKIQLEVSDGAHKVPVIVHIAIHPIDDEAPRALLAPGTIGAKLEVREGDRSPITTSVIKASDPDTDDPQITFIVETPPQFGTIEMDGASVDSFTQMDVENEKVFYVHNMDEIGTLSLRDYFNLSISDMSDEWNVGGNKVDSVFVSVTIHPVDNVPPNVTLGLQLSVPEGDKTPITEDHIMATDIDTNDNEIMCTILSQPQNGYVENISPAPGSEKPRTGMPITAFTIEDIQSNYINYVQSVHVGIEPVADGFTFSCSDGVNFSPPFFFPVIITPVNDEVPEMFMREFVVLEGGDLIIDLPILNAVDEDVPKDTLTFWVTRKPNHGKIVSQLPTGVTEIDHFTLNQISHGSSIVYQHDDSETLEDSFVLTLTDGVHNTSKEIEVMVIPVDDETPRLTINNGLDVEIGETKTITSDMLKAQDLDSFDGNLTYIVRQGPRHGLLYFSDYLTDMPLYNLTKGMNFTQTDIDNGFIKYTHTGREGVRDLIKFDITDEYNTLIDRYFWITIEGIDMIYPDVINKGVELPEGNRVVLTTDILSTSDLNSDDELLQFSITRAPSKGQLESTDNPGIPISSFTQLDLAGNKIYYVHTSDDEVKMDSFEFEVTDGFNSVFRTFRISISDVDNKKPVVFINRLRVKEGDRRLITPFELKAEDKDTADKNLKFTVTQAPVRGKILYNNTRRVNEFTMADMRDNLISYHHDGSETTKDSFWFVITDGTHADFFVYPNTGRTTRKPQKMDIEIVPVDNSVPKMVVNRGASALSPLDDGRIGFQFTKKVLRAQDTDSGPNQLQYIVTRPPKYGDIINVAYNVTVSKFTQADIDAMNINYILRDGVNATGDDFQFKVADAGRNELLDQEFSVLWSWISFEYDEYTINETEKYLKINIVRRGYLGETSFVGLIARNLSAKQDLDFSGHYAKQVQFNPGQSRTQWKIKILDDHVFEGIEKFEIILEEPVLAALEEPTRAIVNVKDDEDESTIYIEDKLYRVEEDVGELQIPVYRKGDLSTEMMVICFTESGTATGTVPTSVLSYSDYISRRNDHTSIIRFRQGDDVQFCRIVVIDDSLYEGEESFKVILTQPIGGKIGQTYNETTIAIEADPKDAPFFYFGESSYKVDESDGYVEITVLRAGTDLSKSATVTVRSKPSDPPSAEAGLDYIGLGRNLDFPPGVTTQTFRVTILDDLGRPRLEGPETFELSLRMPMNAVLGDPRTTVITIDDSVTDLPKMQFQEPTYDVSENDGEVNAIIVRSGDLSHPSTVRCYTRQDTATVMDDYEERPDTDESIVLFEAGEREKKCTVILVNDTIHESNEIFRLRLGSPQSPSAGSALLGSQNVTVITIKDDGDKPIIRFEETRINVKEPRNSESVTTAVLPVVRTGDLSGKSIVRVHTKDGSAKSGLDYLPISKELVFDYNISRIDVEIEILYDEEKEHREAFTVHLRPDKNMIAEVKDTKVIVYIQEVKTVADVTFPSPPIVVSLRDYDNAVKFQKEPIPGYPVICITPCNPRFPDYANTGNICKKEQINDTLTEFRWRVAAPTGEDGVSSDLKNVASRTFFTSTHSITLDSIYFAPGSRVQCAARAVNTDGDPGLELLSKPVTISPEGGLCSPRIEGSFGAEPFTAKMRYTGPEDPDDHRNMIKLNVIVPHRDGMLPIISTRPLSNFELALSPDGMRVGLHKCSNLLDVHEIQTRYGFINRETKNPHVIGEAEPYQYDVTLRTEPTLRFYRNLDLEACMWDFTAYYDMSELVNECGGTISTDGQVLNLVQSFVSIRVPLYVSYIFHSPVATGGWQHSDLSSQLRLTFVYDTAILWQQGISTPEESQLQGHLYPTAMRIQEDGRLVVNFRTEARFRGQFVLSHPDSGLQSTIIFPDQNSLTFTLELIRSEPTYINPHQEWQFVSDYAVRDYSGTYFVKLIPCTVTDDDAEYSLPLKCHPREPIVFNLPIRFQQVSDPVPAEFSLNTQFYLMRKRSLWVSDGSMGFGEDSDASFGPGDKVYGRIAVNPVQNLGDSFHMTVEKCFLCTGVDGYVPKYDPQNHEYGCVADSPSLLHTFKIIDKGAPSTINREFQGVPFNALLADNDPSPDADLLRKQAGADGFHFDSTPLFQVSQGRHWFVHCIYTVRSETNAQRGIGKRSVEYHHVGHAIDSSIRRQKRALTDTTGVGQEGKGTNMHQIALNPSRIRDNNEFAASGVTEQGISGGIDSQSATTEISQTDLLPVFIGIIAFLLVVILTVLFLRKRKEHKAVPNGAVIVATGKGRSRVVAADCTYDDNTEV